MFPLISNNLSAVGIYGIGELIYVVQYTLEEKSREKMGVWYKDLKGTFLVY